MRIYIPATSSIVRTLLETGRLGPAPLTAFAVTPGLREWYIDDDIEELEYVASSEAARASLRLISADRGAARRRFVVSADVPTEGVTVRDDLDRGVVRISSEVALSACACVHADDADAESAVGIAAAQVDAADLGDPAAEQLVGDADGFELAWYATQELGDLIEQLGALPH